MLKCGACDNPDAGYQHTCAGSGTWQAAEAWDADAVLEERSKDWPYFDAKIVFRARAQDEQMLREKLTPLMTAILSDQFTDSCEFSVDQTAGHAS